MLLHPAVRWASIVYSMEAPAPPPFADYDIVQVLDCPTARRANLVGVEGVVTGRAAPDDDDELARWIFVLRFDGRPPMSFLSSELRATGRRAPGGPD